MENSSILRLFLLVCSLYFVKCQFVINQQVEDYGKASLPLILKFLNDDVKATIIYKSGKVLQAQLKGDILEVDLQAFLTCKSSSEQCNYESADCRGLLYAPPNAELQVLSVDCNPNLPIVEEPLALPIQTQQCTGCLTDINVDAEGIEPLVKTIIQHVEAEKNRRYTLLEVLRVQHQIVNGVKFVLTVKIAPAVCDVDKMECTRDPNEGDVYCVVKLFQEPGYEKSKNIISNNCTQSQTFIPTMTKFDTNEMNKIAINSDKKLNHEKDVFKKPERSENDVLNDLMSQIIPLDKFESSSKRDVELVQSNPMKSIESSSVHNLQDENGQPIIISSTFQEVVATEDEPISLGTDTAQELEITSNNPSPSVGILSTIITEHSSPSSIDQAKEVIPQQKNEDSTQAVDHHVKLERLRRSAVNSEKFTIKEKSAIQNIADFIASTLDVIDDDNHKRIVLQIINVKKVRSDSLYLNMNLRIGVSRCGENESGANCKHDLLDTTKFCKVQVMINEDFENPKIVKSHCENEKRNPRKSNHTNDRQKRALLGGKEGISVEDPKVKEYTNEAVNYMNTKLSKGDAPYEITKILSATSQVVSGVSYDIKVEMSSCPKDSKCQNSPKICNINVWYRSWLKSRIITIDCGESKLSFNALEPKNRLKRSVLVGGHSAVSNDDPRLSKHLNKLLPRLDSQSDKEHKLRIKKIISATTQVVAGTNWNIQAEVALSDCSKSDNKKSEECGELKDTFTSVCKFKFWERLPNEDGVRELDNIEVNCDDSGLNYGSKREVNRSKRQIFGGYQAVSTDNPQISEHVNNILPKIDSQSGINKKLRIKRIISASSQVVAGTNWNIKAEFVISDCSKGANKKCNESTTICTFKFWEKLPNEDNVRELTNIEVHCDEPKLNYKSKRSASPDRIKRQVPGGHSSVSSDDPRILKHLNNVLPKLDSQSGKDQKLKIKKIISATSQVVAGTNWNIKAEVVLSDCSKSDNKNSNDCGEHKDTFATICTFKFWEKLPNKDGVRELDNIEVSCDEAKLNYRSKREVYRAKRQVLGGYETVSTDDPQISEHLNNLLPKLDSQSGKNEKLKIKKIISATSQVVAGTNWNIKAEVVLSDCSKSDNKKAAECDENKNSFTTVCIFKFWEKLPNKDRVRELDNIEVSCDDSKINYRSKRQLVGGHNPVSTDDPRILKHLNKVLPKLDSQSGKDQKLKIKKIISATSQVVAGTNWNIKAEVVLSDCSKCNNTNSNDCGEHKDTFSTICTFKFWEKLPNKDGVRDLDNIEVSCDDSKINYRSKRRITGGHNPLSTDDPRIFKHLNNVLPKLDSQSGKDQKLKIKKIISASTQVVAGTNWNIKAEVVLSDCSKSDNKNSNECGEHKDTFTTICTFKFWEKLPDKDGVRELDNIEISCEDPKLNYRSKREVYRAKRQVVGGYEAVSTDDPQISEHLNNLLPKLDSQSGKNEKLKIKKIISATSQVVAGTNWNIKAEVVLSDCSKSDKKKAGECGENKNSITTICTFKFWEKLPNKDRVRELDNIEVSCDDSKLNYRSKRQLAGGYNPLSTDDPRILKHLNNVLPKLDSQSGKDQKLKIKKIISATTQVVAGTNWNIKAEVVLSDCSKSDNKNSNDCGEHKDTFTTICTFKFWEKLPNKDGVRDLDNIEVSCDEAKLNYRSKREVGLPGGGFEVDKNDPLLYEYLSKSLQHIDLNSPEEYKFKVKEIISASQQVVAGDLWRIKIKLILSDCFKNDLTNWDQCGELQGSQAKTCTVIVLDRPWMKQGRETNITCENQKTKYTFRSKRSIQLDQDDHDLHSAAFNEFEEKYKKRYVTSKQRAYRFSIFRENMKYIKLLNDHEEGTAVYGVTQFADLTRKEFSNQLGYRSDLRNENELGFSQAEIPDIDPPIAFDWRDKKAVASVKNQGSCGSCWAFSVTGNVEGQYAIKTGELLEFSEQELVDCDTADEGCNGGLMDNAYRQIERLGGLEQEKDYPYDAKDEKCHFNKSLISVQLSGAVNISTDETDMAKWLVKNGPISIAINANAMQFYMGGVSHPWKFLCNPKNLDHGVLIVGYGVHKYPKFKKSLPYWIVKNSWGTSWGESGYYRVYRGDGTCGVNQTPSSAILK